MVMDIEINVSQELTFIDEGGSPLVLPIKFLKGILRNPILRL